MTLADYLRRAAELGIERGELSTGFKPPPLRTVAAMNNPAFREVDAVRVADHEAQTLEPSKRTERRQRAQERTGRVGMS